MTYIQHYDAPLGRILLAADEVGLTGLWFDGAKYFADGLPDEHTERETPILSEARRWLDLYFAGQEPGFLPPLHPAGSTFQQAVVRLLSKSKWRWVSLLPGSVSWLCWIRTLSMSMTCS